MTAQRHRQSGFTLIELLIVITIIAILAITGIVVYSGFQKNARDARRTSDINAIGDALESSYSTSIGQYVALAANSFANGQVPQDPLTGNNCNAAVCKYCVRAAVGNCAGGDQTVAVGAPAAGATYVVCANLENATGGPGGNSYYCRKNQQ